MNKIMFNDKYGLTQAVLEGRKTQTRRVVGESLIDEYETWLDDAKSVAVPFGTTYESIEEFLLNRSRFKVGEVVAIAQSYKSIGYQPTDKTAVIIGNKIEFIEFQNHKGWNNKMFVSPDSMMNFIRITNVRIERLQDISREDCLAEGVEFDGKARQFYCDFNKSTNSKIWLGSTPREAYAALIDKVGKKGDWDSNPYVFVYDFELVK